MIGQVLIIVLTVLVLTPILLLLEIYRRNRRVIRVASRLPNVLPTLPLLGHIHYTFGNMERLTHWYMEIIKKCEKQNVNIYCIWIGVYPFFFVQTPEDAQIILNSPKAFEKAALYRFFELFWKNSILLARGFRWHKIRKQLNPIFKSENVYRFMPILNKSSKELVTDLAPSEGQGPVNVWPIIFQNVAISACRSFVGLGINFNADSDFFRWLYYDLLK